MPKTYLPDVNVWLALTFDSHIHHPPAKAWFDALSNADVCKFWRLTQQGFLRLATNPSVFGKDAVTLPVAWQKFDIYMSDPRVAFAAEPDGIDGHWRGFTKNASFSPKVWNDAFLAAFALAASLEIVTSTRACQTILPCI